MKTLLVTIDDHDLLKELKHAIPIADINNAYLVVNPTNDQLGRLVRGKTLLIDDNGISYDVEHFKPGQDYNMPIGTITLTKKAV